MAIKEENNRRKCDVVFFALCILILILQVYKASFGMGSNDEHLYAAHAQRLLMGDALFTDEWHITQVMALLVYPFLVVYRAVVGNLDGVIYYLRICYAVFTMLVGTVLYMRFRDRGSISILMAVCFMLFTPFNIMALSYNTMSIGFLVLACCIRPDTKNAIKSVVSGICYALAVVNTPYLAILFLVYLIYALQNWKKEEIRNGFLWSFSGMLGSAIVYLLFVFSRASLAEILQCLPMMVDPSHSTNLIMTMVKNGARLVLDLKWMAVFFVILLITSYLAKDKESKTKNAVFVIASIWVILSSIWIATNTAVEVGSHAEMLCVMSGYGLITYVLTKKKDKRVFISFFVISIVHALLVAGSSNVGPRSFSGPLILASCITILFVYEYFQESETREFKRIGAGALLFFVVFLFFFKYTNIYGGTELKECSTVITNGPLKGLKDSENYVRDYENHLSDVQYINEQPIEYVLYITDNTYMYLASTHRAATNSTYPYFWNVEPYLECLDSYLSMHTEKRPLLIYIDGGNQYGITAEEFSDLTLIRELKCGSVYVYE